MNSIDLKALDAALEARIAQKKLPGVSVAIYGPSGPVFEKGYGIGDIADQRPINENTVMGIASMSKSTVTLALSILAAEGRFDFDDPVVKYFPDFRVPGNPVEDVTCRHLAMHTAGIPPMEPLEWSIALNTESRADSQWLRDMRRTAPNKMDKIEQVIDYIAAGKHQTLGQAGEYMSYSNEGYAVLSFIVDKAAGMTLEQFLSERVFAPIGMTRSVLDLDCSEAKKLASDGNITRLFDEDDDGNLTVDDAWGILPPFRGCACVKSTANDMARYYSCIANRGVIDQKQVIPAAAVEYLIGASFPEGEKSFYCYGLNKRTKAGHVICEHSGGLHGVSSYGGLLKDEGYGFAVLCNKGDEDVDDLCFMLYNAVMGLPLGESHRWLHPAGCDFSEPEMLVGSYICNEGTPDIREVKLADGRLVCVTNLGEAQMVFCGGTWFNLVRGGEIAGRARFLMRDGRAWACAFYTRIFMRIDN